MNVTITALVLENKANLDKLEERLGYTFADQTFLQQALLHSSWAAENDLSVIKNNERLEFLGDAVLDLVVGAALYHRSAEMREGDLSRLRAALVNTAQLAQVAAELSLGEYLFLGKGEDASQGRQKSSILGCA
ncbi:MAG: ribonuclease III, partial [Desulfobulbaceae bacterium]|nr:ribonuclease III [Desulfobulbaceae bacterium]